MFTVITPRGAGRVSSLTAAVRAIGLAFEAKVVDADGVLRARRSRGQTTVFDRDGVRPLIRLA